MAASKFALDALLRLSFQAVAAELTGSAMRVEDFLAVKRTMLKHSGEQAVGEKLEVEALHVRVFPVYC